MTQRGGAATKVRSTVAQEKIIFLDSLLIPLALLAAGHLGESLFLCA
jgi:hypothetical protein